MPTRLLHLVHPVLRSALLLTTSGWVLRAQNSPTAPRTADREPTRVVALGARPAPTPSDTVPPSDSVAVTTPAPAAISVGFGRITFGGELQVWFTDGSAATDNSFRLRRADFRVIGQVNPRIVWIFQIDAAKSLAVNSTYVDVDGTPVLREQQISQASRMLQDAFVTYTRSPAFAVTVGQFRVPFTFEGMVFAAQLETVEQPMFYSDRARGGGLAGLRDVGAMASGVLARRVEYSAGVFNSSGDQQNTTDRDDQKAFVGRVLLRPRPSGLHVGVSGVYGGAPSATRARRDRAAAEIQWRSARFTLRSELVTAVDRDVHRAGYYVHGGFRPGPTLELVARFDAWDPDRAGDATAATTSAYETTVGLSHLLDGNNAKVQLNLSRRDFTGAKLPAVTQLLVNMQVAW